MLGMSEHFVDPSSSKRLATMPAANPSNRKKKFGGMTKDHIVAFWTFFEKCDFVMYEEDQIPKKTKEAIAQKKQDYEDDLEELAQMYLTDVDVIRKIEA
jgi:hypothetical protein